MMTIEIDFDVFKAITLRRESENESENDVLRDVFELGAIKNAESRLPQESPNNNGDWFAKGVRFPESTTFRARFKGQTYHARVDSGSLVVNGKRYNSPSRAANSVTGNSINGWVFWECLMPGQSSWTPIQVLRNS